MDRPTIPGSAELDAFRRRFGVVLERTSEIATERTILLQDPLLKTDVAHLWDTPPTNQRNPRPAADIGAYRAWEKCKCVTADLEVIQAYYDLLKMPPPGFREAGPREFLHFDPASVNVGIVTAGGIAPGLNMVVHALVSRHRFYGTKRIYGFRNGFRGFYGTIGHDDPVLLDDDNTRNWIHRGGTLLGTLREDGADIPAVVDRLQRMDIKILYVVGGNGSLSAAHEISKEVGRRKLGIAVAGVPKTMDNDVRWVWQSFGFTTAVEEATRVINILHEEAQANNRICVVRLFGRNSGFVAANAVLASGEVDAVLIPEENPIDLEVVLEHIGRVLSSEGHAVIVVAEGVGKDGGLTPQALFSELRSRFKDVLPGRYGAFENEPRHQIRAVPAGPADQTYCRRLSDLAVDNALAGFTDFMISCWLTEYVLVPLELVAGRTKQVPTGGIFWKEVRNSTRQPSFRRESAPLPSN